MNHAVTTPLDIKLMNMTAMRSCSSVLSLWGAWSPRAGPVRLPVFDIKGIAVTGDVNHNNALTCVPMWRRDWQARFTAWTWRGARGL
jgi:hypothetical protein